MNRKELLKHIGSVEQVGGITDFTINDGKGKGVRVLEINTGVVRFRVLPDRCMDIAQAFYKDGAFAWISKTGITAPQYYDRSGKEWLRGFYGGLLTTCGFKNLGKPTDTEGLHGRLANIPASKVSVYADWEGDDYIMRVSGEMRECIVFGENLVLKRTITAKLFDNSLTVEDTVLNEGFNEQRTSICYHCNFGYPLVDAESIITNVPAEVSTMLPPTHNLPEECVGVELDGDVQTVGIENKKIGLGAYITYGREYLKDFLIWKMFGESEYVIGLEPRTTNLQGFEMVEKDAFVKLQPFESYTNKLTFTIKEL